MNGARETNRTSSIYKTPVGRRATAERWNRNLSHSGPVRRLARLRPGVAECGPELLQLGRQLWNLFRCAGTPKLAALFRDRFDLRGNGVRVIAAAAEQMFRPDHARSRGAMHNGKEAAGRTGDRRHATG
jgi:hypothetical protein